MKLFKILLLLSIFLVSCSSSDDNSGEDPEINTEVQISFSGTDIEYSTFDNANLSLAQQCEILELGTNTALQNESINITYFLLQLDDIQLFQISNPGELYSYSGSNAYLKSAQAEINSETYISTSLTFEISSEHYEQEGGCTNGNDYRSQVFEINFTIILEPSNNNLNPITLIGRITDFPINPNACAC